jgi:Glycosyl transferase family 2
MPPSEKSAVKVSVVVEWETALEGKPSRAAACLASLRAQVAELQSPCETVLCFDPAQATEGSVRSALGGAWPGPLVVAAVPSGLDYYGKKNHGFTLTSGEVVVFVDSDVVPEPGWLRSIVAPFTDFRVSCVLGRTHLETSTSYERAVALFWIFEERDPSSALRPTGRLVSNNVAFRRALFAHLPFPDRPTFRGQCSELGSMLGARRIAMYEQPAARASHPAPDGVRRFLVRALHAGRDQAFYDGLAGPPGVRGSVRNWRADLANVRARITHRAPRIGAGRRDVLLARLLGVVYYTTKALGYAASQVPSPRSAVRGRPRAAAASLRGADLAQAGRTR